MKKAYKKIISGMLLAVLMVGGLTKVNAYAASDDWYTYYNDARNKQLNSYCTVSYSRGKYTAEITSIGGNGYNKILPMNGTKFSGSSGMIVSNAAKKASVTVVESSTNGTAQFSVSLNNYSKPTHIWNNNKIAMH